MKDSDLYEKIEGRFVSRLFVSFLLIALLAVVAEGQTSRPVANVAANTAATNAADISRENESIRRTASPANSNSPSPVVPKSPAAPSGGLDMQRVVLSLAIVLGLIFVLRWLGRKFFAMPGSNRGNKAMQVVARSMIAPRQHLLLVQVGRRLVVVADSAGRMNSLSEITDPDEVAELMGQIRTKSESPTNPFGNFFGKAKTDFESNSDSAGGVSEVDSREDDDSSIASTREELHGLMDKVRGLAKQFKP